MNPASHISLNSDLTWVSAAGRLGDWEVVEGIGRKACPDAVIEMAFYRKTLRYRKSMTGLLEEALRRVESLSREEHRRSETRPLDELIG